MLTFSLQILYNIGMMIKEKVQTLTEQQILSLAVESVRKSGGLELFWDQFRRLRPISPTFIEAKELLVQHNNYIFRHGRGVDVSKALKVDYKMGGFASREIEGSDLDGFMSKIQSLQPLITEIPNYLAIIKPTPTSVYLLEYQYVVRDLVNIQPLFKCVCEFGARRPATLVKRGRKTVTRYLPLAGQLYIIGRDRHTRDPFALGIPNGFVDQSIETCLRWTMDLHKGDEVSEV